MYCIVGVMYGVINAHGNNQSWVSLVGFEVGGPAIYLVDSDILAILCTVLEAVRRDIPRHWQRRQECLIR